jgi:hypothetical protein
MEEKRPLRRQPEDHNFARSHGRRLPVGHTGGDQGVVFLPPRIPNPLKTNWQRHVLASSGYLELGMFDSAAVVLEESAPEDKNRNGGARRTR